MGFIFSIDLFLGEKACGPKKVWTSCFFTYFFFTSWYICDSRVFMFEAVELFGLGLLVHRCCNPPQKEDKRGGGCWVSDQVLWKPSSVVMQVAGLVTVPRGSWGGDNVLLKLSGVGVQVTGLDTTPGGSNGGYGGGCPPVCRLAQGV